MRRSFLAAFLALPALAMSSDKKEQGMPGFKVYPSGTTGAFYPTYCRGIPLLCDTKEFDDLNAFSIAEHCFIAPQASRWEFYVNLLWQSPPDGSAIKALLMVNQLGSMQGHPGGEFAGKNVSVRQGSVENYSVDCISTINLQAGDKVWAVPCNSSGDGLRLTSAVASNGYATVNYFLGKQVS